MRKAAGLKNKNLLCGGILFLAAVLRLYALGRWDFWYDEAASLMAAQDLSLLLYGEHSPPLYFCILKLWSALCGQSEVAARMLSLIFSLGAVGLVYLYGKKFLTEKHALISALLLAISPISVYYAQETRLYSLFLLLAVLMHFFFRRYETTGQGLGAYTLSALACVYCSYLGFLILGFHFILTLVGRRAKFKNILIAHGLVLIFFLPCGFTRFARICAICSGPGGFRTPRFTWG